MSSGVDAAGVRLLFLGTGASEGTPGEGRSSRRESSLAVSDAQSTLLVDVTRDVTAQLCEVGDIDGVVITHGHRDASGGVPALRDALGRGSPVTLAASPQTLEVLRGRYGRLEHIQPCEVEPGERVQLASWTLTAIDVPHANRPRFRTYAWRLASSGRSIVYASDVGELTDELRDLATGVDLLILDGAMYRRSIFSHLRIEQAVPIVCGWDVARILLTQIGRTAPPHEELESIVADLCPRAAPAYDGMTVEL